METKKREALVPASITFLAMGGLIHIASFIYAPIKSNKINKSRFGDAYPNTHNQRNIYYSFGITPSGGVGGTLRF